jgi:Fe-S cluster biogenesis protein NfuA
VLADIGKSSPYDRVVKESGGRATLWREREIVDNAVEGSIIEIGSATPRPKDGPSEIDREELNSVLEYIRPALQADGGDLVLEGVVGGTVNLLLVGACGGCPISETTVTAGIERILKDRVPGVSEVIATG